MYKPKVFKKTLTVTPAGVSALKTVTKAEVVKSVAKPVPAAPDDDEDEDYKKGERKIDTLPLFSVCKRKDMDSGVSLLSEAIEIDQRNKADQKRLKEIKKLLGVLAEQYSKDGFRHGRYAYIANTMKKYGLDKTTLIELMVSPAVIAKATILKSTYREVRLYDTMARGRGKKEG